MSVDRTTVNGKENEIVKAKNSSFGNKKLISSKNIFDFISQGCFNSWCISIREPFYSGVTKGTHTHTQKK